MLGLMELLKIGRLGINMKKRYSGADTPREREVTALTAQTLEPENIVSMFSLLAAGAIPICDKCLER